MKDKKTLELEKEALLKRLNYALDASGDGIWDWTPSNGVTVYSKAWLEMLGYEVGELDSLASEWSERLHPEDAGWVFAEIGKVIQSPDNGDTFSHEYRFRIEENPKVIPFLDMEALIEELKSEWEKVKKEMIQKMDMLPGINF